MENMTYCYSADLEGMESKLVKVELNMKKGIPRFHIVGLVAVSVREASERVRIAIENSGFEFPMRSVLVNLAPAGVKKEATWFDLSIATCILKLSCQIFPEMDLSHTLILGELGLDGSVKPLKGISNILFDLDEKKFSKIILPFENRLEASISGRFLLYPISHIRELENVLSLSQKAFYHPPIFNQANTKIESIELFQDQLIALRTLEIAVAGRHHALMIGSPGAGKTMLARLADKLQANMTNREYEEILRIKSSHELLTTEESLLIRKPFRSPHHTSSDISLVGGGKILKTGEVSLAHNGILFLDELGEFKPNVIQALREPMEEGKITISRVNYHVTFPASFLLIAATNPCPCGYLESDIQACVCSNTRIERYKSRLSGPFIDRMDLIIKLYPLKNAIRKKIEVNLNELKENIDRAVDIQRERYKYSFYGYNGFLNGTKLDNFLEMETSAKKIADKLYSMPELSIRKINKIKKVARTIADLFGSDKIKEEHIFESINLNRPKKFETYLAA